MKYIEAPNQIDVPGGPFLFLAGGITGCYDWQSQAVDLIKVSGVDVTVLNPRRENFPIDNPSAAYEQILWEHDALRIADVILFWFTAGRATLAEKTRQDMTGLKEL